MRIKKVAAHLAAITLVLAAAGCGASNRSPQLIAARAVVHDATRGRANTLAPEHVVAARKMLKKAEQQAIGSDEEAHLAYLADRLARKAISSASERYHHVRTQAAEHEYRRRLDELRGQAVRGLQGLRKQLEETRSELAKVHDAPGCTGDAARSVERRTELLEREQRLRDELVVRETALMGEQEAKRQAAQRERLALTALSELGSFHEDETGTVLTLSGAALFRAGEVELQPAGRQALNGVASALRALDGSRMIVVVGHTDARGKREHNRKLSLARAARVREYLVEQGTLPHTIRAIGKGEEQPIANNETAEGRANNRRVEIAIRDRKAVQVTDDIAAR